MDNQENIKPPIVIAEDDPDDRLLIGEALEDNKVDNPCYFVGDGEELLEFLFRKGAYANHEDESLPALIILDLNMPRIDGREVLEVLKSHHKFKYIPIVVFTTSHAESDIKQSYDFGVNSYITKPSSYEELVALIKTTTDFWLNAVHLHRE